VSDEQIAALVERLRVMISALSDNGEGCFSKASLRAILAHIEAQAAEIARLRKEQADEIAAWETLYDTMMDVRFEIQDERDAARVERDALEIEKDAQAAEIARLRAALGFYANRPCNLEFGVVNECPYDDGDTARAALTQETQP
jgi:hypothetical protein